MRCVLAIAVPNHQAFDLTECAADEEVEDALANLLRFWLQNPAKNTSHEPLLALLAGLFAPKRG